MCIILAAIFTIAVSGKTYSLISDSDTRKADYIFLEALRHKAAGNADSYYELIEAAYNLNPSDKYLAMEHATRTLLLNNLATDSLATTERDDALRLINDYVASNPTDVKAGSMLSGIAAHFGKYQMAADTWQRLYESNDRRPELGLGYIDALTVCGDSTSIEKALATLNDLETQEGMRPELSMRRMKIYEVRSDTLGIESEAKRLLATAPTDLAYVSFLGRLYMELGKTDSALVYFNRAVEIDPTNGANYYNRAAYYNQIGDSVAYDREVFRAISMPSLDLEPKLEILRAYVIKLYRDPTQRDRISELFGKLIDSYPHEAQVRNLYADYLVAVEDYAGAAEQKSYELDLNPSDPKGWLMLSSLYMQEPDYKRSLDAARRGLHYFPDQVRLYEMASASNFQMAQYNDALKDIREAEKYVDSTDVEEISNINMQIGDIYHKLGVADSVSKYYDKAVLYNNNNLTALNNYAYYIACDPEGDIDKAMGLITRVMNVRDDDPTSLDTYAWVLFKAKDFEKAREIIDKAIDLSDTPSFDLFEHAGDIYFMDGKPDKAVGLWEKALKLNPDNDLLKRKVKYKTFFYK